MEPLIARGFFTLLLTPEQIIDLKAFELTLPPGRYLQGFELGRRYQVTGGEVEEVRMEAMKRLLDQWERSLWRTRQIENKAGSSGLTYQQEIHNWMDYVGKNWHEPLPVLKRRVSDKFEQVGLLLMLMGLQATAFAACREGYVPTDVDGVCQSQPFQETNPAWVSDEKPPKDKMPSWQREGITVIDAPNMREQDMKDLQEKLDADSEGKRRAGLKAKWR